MSIKFYFASRYIACHTYILSLFMGWFSVWCIASATFNATFCSLNIFSSVYPMKMHRITNNLVGSMLQVLSFPPLSPSSFFLSLTLFLPLILSLASLLFFPYHNSHSWFTLTLLCLTAKMNWLHTMNATPPSVVYINIQFFAIGVTFTCVVYLSFSQKKNCVVCLSTLLWL